MKIWEILTESVRKTSVEDIIVGIPAGMVTFVTAFLFTKLFVDFFNDLFNFLILFLVVTYVVGFLIGIVRFSKAPSTAFVSGITSSGLLLFLWINTYEKEPWLIVALLPSLFIMIFISVFVARYASKQRGTL